MSNKKKIELIFEFELSDIVSDIQKEIGKFPIKAERVGAHSVRLLFNPTLTDKQLEKVKDIMKAHAPQLKFKRKIEKNE